DGAGPPQIHISDVAEAWDRTKDTTNIAVLELFVAPYKDTVLRRGGTVNTAGAKGNISPRNIRRNGRLKELQQLPKAAVDNLAKSLLPLSRSIKFPFAVGSRFSVGGAKESWF